MEKSGQTKSKWIFPCLLFVSVGVHLLISAFQSGPDLPATVTDTNPLSKPTT